MGRNKINRTGEENYNNFGTLMKIIEYDDSHNIIVEFQDEYKAKIHTSYQMFKKGGVKNPYDREIRNTGYIGIGKYKVSKNRRTTKAYEFWTHILERCYDPYYINKHLSYIDCYVCEEWHNFQNFAKWFYRNYYEIEGQRMELDKDILYKDNKIYSPETCIFVPQRINVLFVKRQNDRGEYPIGVHVCKATPKNKRKEDVLAVQCSVHENEKQKIKGLGYFPLNRPFQAFYAYKVFKENYIKQVADKYKNLIPQKLYEALYKYQVEIND